jgi:mono/diheme cytochrome c family protein
MIALLSRAAAVAPVFFIALFAVAPASAQAADESGDASIRRGEYVFHAGGCYTCHTDSENHGPPLAGGAPIKTPFGTFYAPNITPDPNFGIGGWSDADFIRALREGVSPDGRNYYPVFPYEAFTKLTDRDILDLKAYIFAQAAVSAPSHPQDVPFWLRWRFVLTGWKFLNFKPGPLPPEPSNDAKKDARWTRGRYLVEALGHCQECHTPRTFTGGLDRAKAFSGTTDGPDGKLIPNISPDKTGIADWTEVDIAYALKTGGTPDGDDFGSLMADVVENGTSHLSDDDRMAIAIYLKSLPPIKGVARPED